MQDWPEKTRTKTFDARKYLRQCGFMPRPAGYRDYASRWADYQAVKRQVTNSGIDASQYQAVVMFIVKYLRI